MMRETGLTAFDDVLRERGATRRDFIKYCGAIAATLGLSELYVPQIAAAIQAGAKLKPVVWLEGGSCSGCTESTAQLGSPNLATLVLDVLSVNYAETIMAGAGKSAEAAKKATIDAGGYILIYEGAVMEGWNGNAFRIADRTGLDDLAEAAKNADAVVAVGSCAVDGGWVAAAPNPAGATGVSAFLKKRGIDKPVINLPTCSLNPEWLVAVVVDVLIVGKLPDLDSQGRPTLIYGATIHDNCPRRGHFEAGEFITQLGNAEQQNREWCLYLMGCKGPQTSTDCARTRWNRKVSWCIEAGAPCIGCGNANINATGGNWVDADAPFYGRMTDVQLPGLGGVRPEVIGEVVAGAAAVGLIAHGIASAATGRTKGPAVETEKVWDSKKGGDKQ